MTEEIDMTDELQVKKAVEACLERIESLSNDGVVPDKFEINKMAENYMSDRISPEQLANIAELKEISEQSVTRAYRKIAELKNYTSAKETSVDVIDAACNGDFFAYQEFVYNLTSERSLQDFESQLLTSGLGLAGEGGECAEAVKKVVFHGKTFDADDYIKELGDLMWYIAFSANMLGIDFQEIVRRNVVKLKDRYKSGKFTTAEFLQKEAAKA